MNLELLLLLYRPKGACLQREAGDVTQAELSLPSRMSASVETVETTERTEGPARKLIVPCLPVQPDTERSEPADDSSGLLYR